MLRAAPTGRYRHASAIVLVAGIARIATMNPITERDSSAKTILAVNDDPAILNLFEDLLTEEGYHVILDQFTRSTGDILGDIRSVQPDLVIMDFIIGGEGTGWQLLQAVRMDRTTRHIPIVVCTGAVHQVEQLATHLSEMNVHVVLKPFDIDHLLEVIASVWQVLDASDTVSPE
jgi:CheY-like chemotaxis protein